MRTKQQIQEKHTWDQLRGQQTEISVGEAVHILGFRLHVYENPYDEVVVNVNVTGAYKIAWQAEQFLDHYPEWGASGPGGVYDFVYISTAKPPRVVFETIQRYYSKAFETNVQVQ